MITTQSKVDYEDFHLLIDQAQNGYRARVIDSSEGEANSVFDLPFDENELRTFFWISRHSLRHLRLRPSHAVESKSLTPQEFGIRLYNAVFAGRVGICLELLLRKCDNEGKGLRICLRLDENVPDLANLPWEYLYIPGHNRFIALSNRTVITRYIELLDPQRPLLVNPPLRILVLVSHPSDGAQLQVERERQLLKQALSGLVEKRLVILEQLQPATLDALRRRLSDRDKAIHILHYIGHGYFDERTDSGGLVLEDNQKRISPVAVDRLAPFLHDHESLRLIFLNACEGARGGRTSFFVGTAQTLVQNKIPAVLAMQFAVSDEAAIVLAEEFYTAIADNYPIDVALAEARKAVHAKGDNLEWGTPILFSRSKDNQILDLDKSNKPPINERQPFEPELIHIPAGLFIMGSNSDEGIPNHETPQHEIILPAYFISKYPITNEQYAEFVRQTGRSVARELKWNGQMPSPAKRKHPVAGVTFQEAVAYCKWLSEKTNRIYQLPTEAHWEKAARMTDGRLYPWGSEWQDNRCNLDSKVITDVDAFPAQNEYDCYDMVGNVAEWTCSLWGERLRQQAREFCYPWLDDQRNDVNANNQIRRVWRGSSFNDLRLALRCTAHGVALPDQRRTHRGPLGFRVIVNLPL